MLDSELARRGVRVSSSAELVSPVPVTPRPPGACWADRPRVDALIDTLRGESGCRTRAQEVDTAGLRARCKRMAEELDSMEDDARAGRPRTKLMDGAARTGARQGDASSPLQVRVLSSSSVVVSVGT